MNNSVITNYEIGKKIVEQLFFCTTKEEVEKIFLESEIDNPIEKKSFLQECMQVEESYDLPAGKLSDDDEYEYELAVFLEGSWRLLII